MTLYDISVDMAQLVDPETGELLGYEAFQALSMAWEKKIENAAIWVKDLEGDAKKIKTEVKSLQKRQDALENRANGLRQYLARALDGEKFSTPRCALTFRRSKALEVSSVYAAAEWLEESGYADLVTRSEPKLDKRAVKQLVDSGENVPGVEVIERSSLQIK